MKVFISWSGGKSREVAQALHEWLPGVINSLEPFVSATDIYAGTRWQSEIASQLDASNFGIVCVTRENQSAPWLNFEAGALAKAVDVSRLVPLAVDLKPSDVQVPLGQFQAQPATEEGVRAVVASLNDALGEERLADGLLRTSLGVWWPRLQRRLENIEHRTSVVAPPARTDRELLEEMLNTVRALARAYDLAGLEYVRPTFSTFETTPDTTAPTTSPEMAAIAEYIRTFPTRDQAEEAVIEIKRLSRLALAILARSAGREAEGWNTFVGNPYKSPVPDVAIELEGRGLVAFGGPGEPGSLTTKGRATARVLPIGKQGAKPEWWDEVTADLRVPPADDSGVPP